MEAIVWLVIFALLVIIEIITLGLTTIWFAAGALVAFCATLVGAPIWLQVILFLIVSIIMLSVTRPIAQRYINQNVMKTNIDGLIGKTAKVTVDINNIDCEGYAILNGQEWTARAEDDNDKIPVGTLVTVKAITGVKLIVSRKEEE